MPSRNDVYTEARRWVGTPYHHEGRVLGQSCDCIGLVIGVARSLGLACPADRDLPRYSSIPHDHVAERTADLLMVPAGNSLRAGQIGLFWFRDRGHGQHFAIFARGERTTMIHAYRHSRRVVETGISPFWLKRLIRVYDYREIANV